MPARVLAGALLVDNRPEPNQETLLISQSMDRLVGASLTGPDGRFAFTIPAGDELAEAIVMLKLRGEVVTVLHRATEVAPATPMAVNVDSTKGFFTIAGTIESSMGWPAYLNVFIDPVHIAGVPEGLERFFKQKEVGVFESRFLEVPVRTRDFVFRVRPGVYRLGGEYINYDRPMMIQPDFKNYVVDRVVSKRDTLPAPGNESTGFTLVVDADVHPTLSLRVVDDSELIN